MLYHPNFQWARYLVEALLQVPTYVKDVGRLWRSLKLKK